MMASRSNGTRASNLACTPRARLLITGATGFVGSAVAPAAAAAGWQVRCLARKAKAVPAPRTDLTSSWVVGEVGDRAAATRALEGCEAALYLVHGLGERPAGDGREVAAATTFARAAADAGVRRIVYLGCIEPRPEGFGLMVFE